MNAITTKATALQTKLAAAIANVSKLQAELDGLTKYDGIVKGDLVGFTFGRAESKVNEQGEVVAISTDTKGNKVFNVLVTKDGKASLRAVGLSAINAHESKSAAAPAEPTVELNLNPADSTIQPVPDNAVQVDEALNVDSLLDAAAQ